MAKTDYDKLTAIQNETEQTGTISDAELEWLTSLIRKSSENHGIVLAKVLATFELIKHPTPSQENRMFNTSVALLSEDGANDPHRLATMGAIRVLARLGDNRAVPHLREARRSPSPKIRELADRAIAKLQNNSDD